MTAYQAEKFKSELIDLINNSNLTLPTAYYVLKDVFNSFQTSYIESSKIEPNAQEEEEIVYGDKECIKEDNNNE